MKDDDDDVRMHATISGGVWGEFVSHKIVILYCCVLSFVKKKNSNKHLL